MSDVPIIGQTKVKPAAPYRPNLDNIGFRALGDVIVAVLDEHDTTTKGGIVIPERSQRAPFHIALSVGDDVKGISVGDRIMATGGANMETSSGGLVFFFRAKDVLALVERLEELKDDSVPVELDTHCARCGGSGAMEDGDCPDCDGTGREPTVQ